MKWFAIYWMIGCFILGNAVGWYREMCPNDEMPDNSDIQMLSAVAIWPASVVAALIYDAPPFACEVQP